MSSVTGNHRIMLVDDELDVLHMIEKYLKTWNFEVYAFGNPVEALGYFKDNSSFFALVITDLRMPGMSGLELARRLLDIKPDVKVILMTAFEVEAIDLEHSLPAIQREDILKKPFRLPKICTAVKKQLQIA